jgi:hypothetical protein
LTLTIDSLDGSVKSISRGKVSYIKTASGVFTYGKRHIIRQTPMGFRWSDRFGNTIEFDPGSDARLLQPQPRQGELRLETVGGTKRVSGVKDHFDKQVLWYSYTNDQLTAIRDYTEWRVTLVRNLINSSKLAALRWRS